MINISHKIFGFRFLIFNLNETNPNHIVVNNLRPSLFPNIDINFTQLTIFLVKRIITDGNNNLSEHYNLIIPESLEANYNTTYRNRHPNFETVAQKNMRLEAKRRNFHALPKTQRDQHNHDHFYNNRFCVNNRTLSAKAILEKNKYHF